MDLNLADSFTGFIGRAQMSYKMIIRMQEVKASVIISCIDCFMFISNVLHNLLMLATQNTTEVLAEEELPLPSFAEVFGDGGMGNSLLKKRKKSNGAMGKMDSLNGEETTGLVNKKFHERVYLISDVSVVSVVLIGLLAVNPFVSSSFLLLSRWTPDEHRLFLEGIMLYGKDWKKMQPLIKTRTLVQIRTHAQKVFKKIGLKKMSGNKRKENVTKDGAQQSVGDLDEGKSSSSLLLDPDNDMDDGDVSGLTHDINMT